MYYGKEGPQHATEWVAIERFDANSRFDPARFDGGIDISKDPTKGNANDEGKQRQQPAQREKKLKNELINIMQRLTKNKNQI